MFICVIQLSINRVSFLGSINKCQVEKHFRSKQSLKMFLFILKYVRIFYNFLSRNVHALCQQNQIILWKKMAVILLFCKHLQLKIHTIQTKWFSGSQVVSNISCGVPQSSDFWFCALINSLPGCLPACNFWDQILNLINRSLS